MNVPTIIRYLAGISPSFTAIAIHRQHILVLEAFRRWSLDWDRSVYGAVIGAQATLNTLSDKLPARRANGGLAPQEQLFATLAHATGYGTRAITRCLGLRRTPTTHAMVMGGMPLANAVRTPQAASIFALFPQPPVQPYEQWFATYASLNRPNNLPTDRAVAGALLLARSLVSLLPDTWAADTPALITLPSPDDFPPSSIHHTLSAHVLGLLQATQLPDMLPDLRQRLTPALDTLLREIPLPSAAHEQDRQAAIDIVSQSRAVRRRGEHRRKPNHDDSASLFIGNGSPTPQTPTPHLVPDHRTLGYDKLGRGRPHALLEPHQVTQVLRSIVQNDLGMVQTARELGMHPNSLRLRLLNHGVPRELFERGTSREVRMWLEQNGSTLLPTTTYSLPADPNILPSSNT